MVGVQGIFLWQVTTLRKGAQTVFGRCRDGMVGSYEAAALADMYPAGDCARLMIENWAAERLFEKW
jgi:hypothetical protein